MSSVHHSSARGLGSIAVIVVLVLLATLAAAIVRVGGGLQSDQAQALLGTRAQQAARAGTDWGAWQALKGSWTSCSGQSQTLDLRADTGMRVTVSCSSLSYREGESAPGTPQTLRVTTLDAVACNAVATCPDDTAAAQPGYIERRRHMTLAQ